MQSINQAQLSMVASLVNDVIQPLKMYAEYDFLEAKDVKKLVTSTANEIESLSGKIDSLQGGKKFGISRKEKAPDPQQIAQVGIWFWKLY